MQVTRPGESFEAIEVAEAYLCRPDYASGIYRELVAISPGHHSVLDLGCGTGKISRRLSGYFQSVTAVDASSEMLRVASTQIAANPERITWIHGLAEEVPFSEAPFDLVVAAASIHWMNHAVVFPKLLSCVHRNHIFAAVDGDGAHDPPWQSHWDSFLKHWIYELKGEVYEPNRPDSEFHRRMNSYRSWLSVVDEVAVLSDPVRQSVEDFVSCQHSRDTFAPAKLGHRLRQFDEELRTMLAPYADDGVLTYSVRSNLVWGTIRNEPDGGVP